MAITNSLNGMLATIQVTKTFGKILYRMNHIKKEREKKKKKTTNIFNRRQRRILKPPTSSTKSNSDEDKPLTPLKKKRGPTDRFARDCRQGFKELGDKVGKNIKEGMLVASEKVKEGVKEADEKADDKVKEGFHMSIEIDISDKLFALILIINFTWLGFFIWNQLYVVGVFYLA